MGGVLAPSCNIPAAATSIDNLTGGVADNGAGGLNYVGLIQANGTAQAGGAHLNYAGAFCNTAPIITLTTTNGSVSSGLTAVAGFANEIDYTATPVATGCGVAGTMLQTDGNAAGHSETTTCTNPITGFYVDVDTLATADPLLAGTYTDILVVTFTP
jgi:hypothetical protein